MNLKSSKKLETNRYELEIEISKENFSKAIDKAYRKNIKKISIPGFRRGKAPRAFVEKYYGENIFYEDAINSIYPEAVEEAVKEANLEVINDKVDFDIVEIGKDKGLTFKVSLTVKPEVNIQNYKGIEIKAKPVEVTEEEISKELEKQRERNARFIEVTDRAAKDGDIVVIDFKGSVDGVAFDGGEGTNHSLKLGSKQFIEGFEEQIVGHKKDEDFSINVKFPEDYGAKDLAGKDAVFEIKLHEIKEKELPELDDEFVKDISEFDTLKEYKEDVKAKLLESKETESKNDIDNQIIDKVNGLLEAEIPEAMFENKVNEDINDFARRLQSQGLDMKTYMQYTGLDNEKFKKEFRPMAERQVKLRLALEKISELEKLEPTAQEIENKYKEYAENYKMDVEKIRTFIPEKDIKMDLSCEKAIDFLRENAKIS